MITPDSNSSDLIQQRHRVRQREMMQRSSFAEPVRLNCVISFSTPILTIPSERPSPVAHLFCLINEMLYVMVSRTDH